MQPTIKYHHDYCKIDCNVCYKICPTGAIVDFERSGHKKTQIQIGIAKYESENCLVKIKNIKCGFCAEVCPLNAISLIENPQNKIIPSINKEKCIGCGTCEYMCPTKYENKAI